MKINKDSSQTIYNILSQLILNGINFVLIMLFTRHLSTNDYGVVSIYQAYVLFFAVLVGLNTQGSIGTAFSHIESREHKDYLASILALSTISFMIVSGICCFFISEFSTFSQLEPLLIVLLLLHSFGNFCFQFINISFVYSRKAQYSCLLAFIVAALMIGISAIGIKYPIPGMPQYMGRIWGLALPYIVCIVFVFINIFTKGNPFKRMKRYWLFCLPICIPLVFHGFSQVVLAQTDKIMLQKMVGDNGVVGIYSFFVTFVHVLNSLYTALNNTWVPIYYNYTKENQVEKIKTRSRKYHAFFTIMVIGFMFVSPEIVKIFADSKYWGGMRLIPIVACSIYMVFMYSFAVNFELYHRKSKWIAVGTTAAAIINIILNAILIPVFGMYGAAIATLGAYIMLFIFHDLCARKIIKDGIYPYKRLFFAGNTCAVVFFSLLFYAIINLWIFRWFIAILAGLYLICMIKKNKSIF